ncbi:hypothetical protein ID0463_06610 [Helicobacter pylori]
MELKNIISETLSEIEKMAKTIDDGFDRMQKTPAFFKTPPHLQNTPNPKNANAPLEPKNAAKIETQEKITEEKEEESKEIIKKEITPKTPTQETPTQENPTQTQQHNNKTIIKNYNKRTTLIYKNTHNFATKKK